MKPAEALVMACVCAGLLACQTSAVNVAGKPVTVRVAVPAKGGSALLRILDIESDGRKTVLMRVFADTPAATRESDTGAQNLVGYVTLLGSTAEKRRPASVVLDLSKQAKSFRGRPLAITLVPMNDTEVRIGKIEVAVADNPPNVPVR